MSQHPVSRITSEQLAWVVEQVGRIAYELGREQAERETVDQWVRRAEERAAVALWLADARRHDAGE